MDWRRHCGAAPEARRVTLPGSGTREGRRPGASIRPCPVWPGATRIPSAFRTRDLRSKGAEFVRSREARRGGGWRTRGGGEGKPSTAALPMGSGSWTGGATTTLPLKPVGSPSRGAGRGKAGDPAPDPAMSGVTGSHANTERVQDTGPPLEGSGIRPIPRGASWQGLEDAREDEGEGERGKALYRAPPAQCGLLLLHEGSRWGTPARGLDVIADHGRRTMKVQVEGLAGAAYAGVGSRSTPAEVLHWMESIGRGMARAGMVLRSGAARGADSAFERGCDRARAGTSGSTCRRRGSGGAGRTGSGSWSAAARGRRRSAGSTIRPGTGWAGTSSC